MPNKTDRTLDRNSSEKKMIRCKYCNILFIPYRKWQLFHNKLCRYRWHNDQHILNESMKDIKKLESNDKERLVKGDWNE